MSPISEKMYLPLLFYTNQIERPIIDRQITLMALKRGLFFRELKPLAVISGAGISGLAASFELRARGFNVVIVEKRKSFTRFNIINLSIETQKFLKKFHLLEDFEKNVASRIKEHRYLLIDKSKSATLFNVSDVSQLQFDETTSFEPRKFSQLFTQDGVYSVSIMALQSFLAESALKRGVTLLGDTSVRVLKKTTSRSISKVQVTPHLILKPCLFFIAEGIKSSTAKQLGIQTRKIVNVCTDENWIFGNMSYSGNQTFVVSLIDNSEKNLRLANIIFNAKSHTINIAVTTLQNVSIKEIKKQLLQTITQVFEQKATLIEAEECTLLKHVTKPVTINNRILKTFSVGNAFCLGDTAVTSSPLAGSGGTIGLTTVPYTVSKLLDDYEKQAEDLHCNFYEFSEAYSNRWIQKSEGIKQFCLNLFHSKQ